MSVIDHDAKVRDKNELNQVVEIIKDHDSLNFWEANLRNAKKQNFKSVRPPTSEREHRNLLEMQKTTKFNQMGNASAKRWSNYRQVSSTKVTKVPDSVTNVRS